jgi:hypothetical protein
MPPTPRIVVRHRQVEPRHSKDNLGAKPKGEVMVDILLAIRERRA